MNKEIKEILDNPKILMLSYGNYISLDDYVKLKDYITNLQEEYDNEVEENLKLSEWLVEKQQEIEKYKSRIEKAVEYIGQYDGHIEGYYYSKENKRFLVEENVKDDLLNILNGKE